MVCKSHKPIDLQQNTITMLKLKRLYLFYALQSQPPNREDTPTPQPSDKASSINQTPVEANEFPQLPEGLEKKPIVLKFSAMMDGISIGAALLPSLKAEYKMGPMKSHGMTGMCLFLLSIHTVEITCCPGCFFGMYLLQFFCAVSTTFLPKHLAPSGHSYYDF